MKRHDEFLKRAALKEAQKAIRSGRLRERSQVPLLEIQTVELWKRVLVFILATLGLIFGVLIGLEWTPLSVVLGAVFLMFSGYLFRLSVRGKRKSIDSAIDAIDVISIVDSIF